MSFEETFKEKIESNPYSRFLGLEFLTLEKEYSIGRIPFRKEFTNPYGSIHGGCLYSLADIVAGAAACMAGHYVTTASGTLNFVRAAINTEYVTCEAKEIRSGRHLSVYDVRIMDDKRQVLDSGEFVFFVTEYRVCC